MHAQQEGSRAGSAAGGAGSAAETPRRTKAAAKGKAKTTTPNEGSSSSPRPKLSARSTTADPTRTASPAQEAPYLTHLTLHRGLRTLVAPDNLGRQRPQAQRVAATETSKKTSKAAGVAPEVISAVLNAGRSSAPSPRRLRPVAAPHASPPPPRRGVRTHEVAGQMSRGNSSESIASGSSRAVSPAPPEASTSRHFFTSLEEPEAPFVEGPPVFQSSSSRPEPHPHIPIPTTPPPAYSEPPRLPPSPTIPTSTPQESSDPLCDSFVRAWEADRAAGLSLDLRVARDLERRRQLIYHTPASEPTLSLPPLTGTSIGNIADSAERVERTEIEEADSVRDAPRLARALSVSAGRKFAEAAERRRWNNRNVEVPVVFEEEQEEAGRNGAEEESGSSADRLEASAPDDVDARQQAADAAERRRVLERTREIVLDHTPPPRQPTPDPPTSSSPFPPRPFGPRSTAAHIDSGAPPIPPSSSSNPSVPTIPSPSQAIFTPASPSTNEAAPSTSFQDGMRLVDPITPTLPSLSPPQRRRLAPPPPPSRFQPHPSTSSPPPPSTTPAASQTRPARPLPIPPVVSDRVDAFTALFSPVERESPHSTSGPLSVPSPSNLAIPRPPRSSASSFEAPPSDAPPPQGEDQNDFVYTDLDLLLARLEENDQAGANYDDLLLVGEVLGPARAVASSTSDIESLILAPVEVERRRIDKQGKVKLKLSCVGVRVLDCTICLSRFRAGEFATVLPRCTHAWLLKSQSCPLCRVEVFEKPMIDMSPGD